MAPHTAYLTRTEAHFQDAVLENPPPVLVDFWAPGAQPAITFLWNTMVEDVLGYSRTRPGSTHTSVAGVFAAGDVASVFHPLGTMRIWWLSVSAT